MANHLRRRAVILVAVTAIGLSVGPPASFCLLFGTYRPFDQATLDDLYPTRIGYVARVVAADALDIRAGNLLVPDALENLRDALASGVGR